MVELGASGLMARQQFGSRAMLYRLSAKVDVASIAEEEVRASGWDRSDLCAFLIRSNFLRFTLSLKPHSRNYIHRHLRLEP